MICPSCKAVVDVLEGACPTCQDAAQPPAVIERAPRGLAIAVARQPMTSSERPAEGSLAASPSAWPLTVRPPAMYALQRRQVPAHPVLAALPRLPALLWRQPIVRATVRTGASAVALSLALRMARRVLAHRAAPSLPRSATLPALADLLAAPTTQAPRRRARHRRHAAHAGETVETFIYIRRTLRDTR